ncbi:MAG: hypothetical protein ABSH16_05530 [Sedimentisphaerales bacterium]
MMKNINLYAVLIAFIMPIQVLFADWDPGDPALYYQTPAESDAWSVNADWGRDVPSSDTYRVADDWTAAQTSAITGISFWGGWKHDLVGQTTEIYVRIFNNDTSTPGFFKPGQCVWSCLVNPGEYTHRRYNYDSQDQIWYEPQSDYWFANDHRYMYQYNIPVISSPFVQHAGLTYWLMITANVEGGDWGWNTAQTVTGSSAVYWNNSISDWSPLMTPSGYQDPQAPLDLAFVLVPEPAMRRKK